MGKGGFPGGSVERTCLPVQETLVWEEQLSLRVTTLGPCSRAWEPQLTGHTPGACAPQAEEASATRDARTTPGSSCSPKLESRPHSNKDPAQTHR